MRLTVFVHNAAFQSTSEFGNSPLLAHNYNLPVLQWPRLEKAGKETRSPTKFKYTFPLIFYSTHTHCTVWQCLLAPLEVQLPPYWVLSQVFMTLEQQLSGLCAARHHLGNLLFGNVARVSWMEFHFRRSSTFFPFPSLGFWLWVKGSDMIHPKWEQIVFGFFFFNFAPCKWHLLTDSNKHLAAKEPDVSPPRPRNWLTVLLHNCWMCR